MSRALLVIVFAALGCNGLIGEPGVSIDDERPLGPFDRDPSDPGPGIECDGVCVGPSGLARLTRSQYRFSVQAVFGSATDVDVERLPSDLLAGPFRSAEPAGVTERDVDMYASVADAIAVQVAPDLAAACDPASCGADIARSYGSALFRRPVDAAEEQAYQELFAWSAADDGTTGAVELVVATLLSSPSFLYVVEHAADTEVPTRLSGLEVAARLSLFFWGEGPDEALRDAALAGELDREEGVAFQARRLLSDPRADRAIGEFHRQWLGIEEIGGVSSSVERGLQAETERFAADVIRGGGDSTLRRLFTDSRAPLDEAAAGFYGVSATDATAVPGHVGILTHASVLASHSAEGFTRPVHRGLLLRTRVLCQSIAAPPGDALEGVEEAADALGDGLTDREKLATLTGDPGCATCHAAINPPGYALEAYDADGIFRNEDERGRPIDSSGELAAAGDASGPFEGVADLMPRLADSEIAGRCISRQWLRFALRRADVPADETSVAQAYRRLAETDGNLADLLVALTTTDAFLHRLPR